MLTEDQEITTNHNHHNKIIDLIIFRVIDSKVTKSSVHFSRSSFKIILLIFYPTCWIDLHYWNLNSPDDEWMKSHPKQSSFVAWILNYLYELTLILTLNARNRNQKESDWEQDSCRTRNQDFVALAPCHMPIEVVCQSERAPTWWENAFWSVCFGQNEERCSSASEAEWENEEEFDTNEPRTVHWKNAEPRFRDTRTMPYACWGGEF